MKRVALLFAASLVLAACGTGTAASKTPVHRMRGSSMEPTLHCAKPGVGCQGRVGDRIVVQPDSTHLRRGDILAFYAPAQAIAKCGERGIFVQRLIGQSDETVHEDDHGFVWIDGKRLNEPYVLSSARLADTQHFGKTWHVANGWFYFTMGDNRSETCDSRVWGSVPNRDIIGRVVKILRDGAAVTPPPVPYPTAPSTFPR